VTTLALYEIETSEGEKDATHAAEQPARAV
jgi:hypothetical protein